MNDVTVVLAGEAGQGIQTVEHLLTRVLKLSGYHVFAVKEYMSRVRGGTNSTCIRVSSAPVDAFSRRIDLLVPLSREAVAWLGDRVGPGTLVLRDRENLGDAALPDGTAEVDLPLGRLAAEAGGAIYAATVAAGALSTLFCAESAILDDLLRRRFGGKGDQVVSANLKAAELGRRTGEVLKADGRWNCSLVPDPSVREAILVNGGEAVSLGAIAGGCDFIASYPMSPSTSVLTFLAGRAREFGIVVEQAEDEIAAVNMALGAWYAGARGMVTTSGGGFALMTEGVSLAGMLESPLVVHLGQRPGPATGLPTRTEQGDLELVLHAGHGEFPRVVLAPGSVEEAFDLTRRAFDLADRYQVPVFVLTDQYLIDAYRDLPGLPLDGPPPVRHTVRTADDYRRFALTPDGLSPRGVPGEGDGIVVADSDEHDEEGRITEDRRVRRAMVDKRLRKGELLVEAALPPVFSAGELSGGTPPGRAACPNLVVGWGSTFAAIREAVAALGRDDVEWLHFSQVWPVHPSAREFLDLAGKVIFVEGNATGQFARVLKAATGWQPRVGAGDVLKGAPAQEEAHIRSYDGWPASVEELAERLAAVLEGAS